MSDTQKAQHGPTPWRWQEHFRLWLETRPDMKRRGLTDQLEEYVRIHPELARKVNEDVR